MNKPGGRCGAMIAACALLHVLDASAQILPARGSADSRIRVARYSADQVYELQGFVGYQIDLEFAPGETFVGLGAGDIEGLSFAAQGNHLFLKPKAAQVRTNLTVLTTRRHYLFDYTASARRPQPADPDVIYSLRFQYPAAVQVAAAAPAVRIEAQLDGAAARRPHNIDYWYCGSAALKPIAASDDGVHTRLRFGVRSELPALFVRNDDGSESLLNFSMDAGDVIVHRVVRRLIVRRGRLQGCIVNKAFAGGGVQLKSGTVAPDVERVTRGAAP